MRSGCLLKGLLLLLAIVGVWEACTWFEAKRRRLAEVKAQTVSISGTLADLEKKWKTIKQAQTDLKALRQREDEAHNAQDRISEQRRRLTAEIKYLALSMREAVTKVRKAAIDTRVAELKLEGRASLSNARILKITDDSITFLHEDGVANLKLESEQLPESLTQRFDIGPEGITARLERLLKDL